MPGPRLELGFPAILTRADFQPVNARKKEEATTGQRSVVADWITDPERGAGFLLARVAVNRMWKHHFGEGLVRTPSDFGTQGDKPALPELLDWLATAFIESGWSQKAMHRLIMTSAAYRQNDAYDEVRAQKDPDNRLWWRRRPMRLEAEVLRDTILYASGKLNQTMYGPGFFVPIPAELAYTQAPVRYPTGIKDGPEIWRRAVYAAVRRSVPAPAMQMFDAPDPTASCGGRDETTVATQALFMLNDDFVRARSRDLAVLVMQQAPADPAAAVRFIWRQAFGRVPQPPEVERGTVFLARQKTLRQGDALAAMVDFCHRAFCLNEFVYVD